MNERDKELARQAWTENDWDGHVDIPKLIQLVRADAMEAATRAANVSWSLVCKKMVEFEREACAKVCESLWRIDGQFTADEFASEVRARSGEQK